MLSEAEYKSLRFILSDYKECVCFQRHRPIRKVERSSLILLGGLILNLAVIIAYYEGLLKHLFSNGSGPIQKIGILISIITFIISLISFALSILVQPGYLKPQYEFIWLVDSFLEQNIHLDNLCVFDEVIKTENSFHCTICNKCSDHYDHHCPFIDNCLGTRNHKYFLVFLLSYFIYSLLIVAAVIWKLKDIHKDVNLKNDLPWTLLLFILIVLPLPVLVFQLKE